LGYALESVVLILFLFFDAVEYQILDCRKYLLK